MTENFVLEQSHLKKRLRIQCQGSIIQSRFKFMKKKLVVVVEHQMEYGL